ncbi:MAG: hypothetical protein ABUM26_02605, partial [Solirubrobacterales bacterium]
DTGATMHQPLAHDALTPRRTPVDLRAVTELDDRIGVLTAYFPAGPRALDVRVLRDKLMVLRERARSCRARDRRALSYAADRVLERARLASGASGTAALAIFWRLDAGESLELALPCAVGCTATVAPRALVGPLCAAAQAGRPAGALNVGDDLGALYEVGGGMVATPPRLLARTPAQMREEATRVGRKRGWDLVVVDGHAEAVERTLGQGVGAGIGADAAWPRFFNGRDAPAAGEAGWPEAATATVVAERRRRAGCELAALLDVAACGEDTIVCDLDAVRDALGAGRVCRLLVAEPHGACDPLRGGLPWPKATEALLHAAVLDDVEIDVAPAPPRPSDVPFVIARLDRSGLRPGA